MEMQNERTRARLGTDQVLYILGGFGDAQTPVDVVERFDSRTNQITFVQASREGFVCGCSNNLSTGCVRTACSQLVDKLSTACWQLSTRLLSSTDLLQVVPTTCYRPAIQQFINN